MSAVPHAIPSRAFVELFIDFLDDLRKAQTVADVNLAAGIALLELTDQYPDGLGQIIHLPFNAS